MNFIYNFSELGGYNFPETQHNQGKLLISRLCIDMLLLFKLRTCNMILNLKYIQLHQTPPIILALRESLIHPCTIQHQAQVSSRKRFFFKSSYYAVVQKCNSAEDMCLIKFN